MMRVRFWFTFCDNPIPGTTRNSAVRRHVSDFLLISLLLGFGMSELITGNAVFTSSKPSQWRGYITPASGDNLQPWLRRIRLHRKFPIDAVIGQVKQHSVCPVTHLPGVWREKV